MVTEFPCYLKPFTHKTECGRQMDRQTKLKYRYWSPIQTSLFQNLSRPPRFQ